MRPLGARPKRQSKSSNSKWRSGTDLDWKGCYLLDIAPAQAPMRLPDSRRNQIR